MFVSKSNVTCIDSMGNDLSVVNAARVSFAKQRTFIKNGDELVLNDKDEKLIKYLAEHNHWTPFGHCCASLHIKAPMFVARQLYKHQVGGVINEISRRYVDSQPEFYLPDKWRKKHENKKQGSYEDQFVDVDNQHLQNLTKHSITIYNEMIESGVAPEMARMILPQNMMVEWYWTGSLYFFARVCNLRLSKDVQLETQDVARQIYNILKVHYPVSTKYIIKHVDKVP